MSGSTGIILFVVNQKVFIANVGDSRAYVILQEETTTIPNILCRELNRDLTPDLPEEKDRILRCGGEISQAKGKFKLNLDRSGEFFGPPRIWAKNKRYPGLMMSRTFGDDMGHSCGVIATPEINLLTLTPECEALILTSDGVSDKMNINEVASAVSKYVEKQDAYGASREIVKQAQAKWSSVNFFN